MQILQIQIIQKDGYWYLKLPAAEIRSPYMSTKDRNDVVAYAKRAFPDAVIILNNDPA